MASLLRATQNLLPRECSSLWNPGAREIESTEGVVSDESLEYLTPDNVSWSQGHQRPRMDPEERKARHRFVQRRHMERKHARIAHLQVAKRVLELRIKLLHAEHEAQQLIQERHKLREQIEARNQPWALPLDQTPDNIEELAILELLELLPFQSSDTLPSAGYAFAEIL